MKRPYLWLCILSFICVACTIVCAFFKYASLHYNTLDLAIYAQVFWNTAHGDFFASSIQNINYLGDHVELWIVPLSVLFKILPHPLTLVVLQAAALFGSSLLLFRLARNYTSTNISFIIACAYLLNPVIWNMAWADFHMLIFAIPLIFLMLDFLKNSRWWPFVFATIALLLVREDAAFALIGIGLFALFSKSKRKYWLFAILSAIVWFGICLLIVRSANPDGYKFFAYYGWLGSDLPGMLTTLVTRPVYVLINLLHPNNLLLIIACILLLFGLPIFGGAALLVALPAFLQLLFGRFNPQILIGSHYLALVLPALIFASIKGLTYLQQKSWRWVRALQRQPRLLLLILSVVCLYSFLFLSPIIGSIRMLHETDWQAAKEQRALLDHIPNDASVISSFGMLPNVSQRKHAYLLRYLAMGKKQFSENPYITTQEPSHIIFDLNDLTLFELQYAQENGFQDAYTGLHERLTSLLADYEITKTAGNILLLERNSDTTTSAVASLVQKNISLPEPSQQEIQTGPITLLQYTQETSETLGNVLRVSWKMNEAVSGPKNGYAWYLSSGEQFIEVPMGWNLFPLHALKKDDVVSMLIPLPKLFEADDDIYLQLEKRKGYAGLNGLVGASAVITHREFFSEKATIKSQE